MRGSPATPLVGAHMSTAGGLHRALERGRSIGCTAIQIFVKNNMRWLAPRLRPPEIRAFLDHPLRPEIRSVFAHAGYLINLAAPDPDTHARSLASLAAELVRADQLELPFLVLHPGNHMGAGVDAGLRRVIDSIDGIHRRHPAVATRIALETTAGQGTSLGHEIDHLRRIAQGVREPGRILICVDTAHLFAAGHDISTERGARRTFDAIARALGRERIAAVHCNDSRTALGSRVDRHAHIGEGRIGLAPFAVLMNAPAFRQVPKVLETPKEPDLADDARNLATLFALVRPRPAAGGRREGPAPAAPRPGPG